MKKFLSTLVKTAIFTAVITTVIAACMESLLFVFALMKSLLLGAMGSMIPLLETYPKLMSVVSHIITMVVAVMLIIMTIKLTAKDSTYTKAIAFTKKLWLAIPPR